MALPRLKDVDSVRTMTLKHVSSSSYVMTSGPARLQSLNLGFFVFLAVRRGVHRRTQRCSSPLPKVLETYCC